MDISKLINDLGSSFFLNLPDTGPKIEKVGGDASARRYYRIKAEESSYILCRDETLSGPENNNLFCSVQKILKSYDIPVPELYDTNLDSSMVLEQDLGDDTLLKMLSSYHDSKKELEIYKSILNIMIKIHTIDSSNHRKESFTKISFDNYLISNERNGIGLRFGTVNGVSQNMKKELMINSMIKSFKDSGEINIMNKDFFRPILWINDLLQAIDAILESSTQTGIYNLASFNSSIGS